MFSGVFCDLRNVFEFKSLFVFYFSVNGKLTHPLQISALPNPDARIVGANAKWIAPGVNGNKSIVDCGGNMHGTAVDASCELRGADEMNQLEQGCLVGQV